MSKVLAIGDEVTLKSGKQGQIVDFSIGRSHGVRWIIHGYNFKIVVKPNEICGYEESDEAVEFQPEIVPDSKYVHGCAKSGYISKDAANRRIKSLKKHSSRSKIPVRAYWCRDCKMYHLTSKSDDK